MSALRGWRTVRRYAVPPTMIRQATERRLAGDWRGACAAAGMAADVDLAAVAGRYGADVAARVENDVRCLAPDLLRWHLPRRPSTGKTALSPRRLSVLARYGGDGPVLYAGSPRTGYARQRLSLFVDDHDVADRARPHGVGSWYAPDDLSGQRHLWDANRAGELLTWYGLDQVPGFDPTGRRVEPSVTATDTLVQHLQDAGFLSEAWDLVGVDVPDVPPPYGARLEVLTAGFWCRLPDLVREVRRIGADSGGDRVWAGFAGTTILAFEQVTAERMRLKVPVWHPDDGGGPYVALDRLGLPIDALLLRLGLLTPGELHPLVHAAFFPTAGRRPAGAPGPVPPEPVRVRCRGEWHEVRMDGGATRIPHGDDEQRREAALQALGGTADGCFAVAARWRSGTGRLPRRLRELRRELMQRALHGDTEGVTALLNAGLDPHVRDDGGRTLLHLAAHLDDPGLVRRLLAAGLDVDARDAHGITPLFAAVHGMGSVAVIRVLVEAGARTDTTDESSAGWGEPALSVADWAVRARQADLEALRPLLGIA
ncbi:ankyrin repeat domain-containing protein [Dactylosporangium sp. NPDC005572]|uniref:ankyrin repeat domain-containing protein n=1 Tax=Dactylosporangium sp. NPDC005572 TaxID=3156889 RepID=UPI0033A5B9F8